MLKKSFVVAAMALGSMLAIENVALADGGLDVSVTPRVWYRMSNDTGFLMNRYKHVFPNLDFKWKDSTVPVYGLSVGIKPQAWTQTDILINGYFADASVNGTVMPQSYPDRKMESDRVDVELLGRYRPGASNLSLVGGVRVIYGSDTYSLRNAPAANTLSATGTPKLESTTAGYLAEFGVQDSFALSADGRHSVFGSVVLGAGVLSTTLDNCTAAFNAGVGASKPGLCNAQNIFAASTDFSLGYQYRITDSISANIRYRVMSFFREPDFIKDAVLMHGPEVGATFRF